MGIEVRSARPADAEALGRMHWASWREAYALLLPADFWTAEGEAARIERWHRNLASPLPGSITMVAVRGAEVVGHASSGPSRPNETAGPPVRDRELWSAYVLASEYGTGLASRLLEAVLPAGTPAELWVFEANPRARAFYTKQGFAPDGARHEFGPELHHQAEIRMVR
ncbi:MAG: GNAT family N-acetyltransferase [Acidobacteria bacterium]|nr:GNAT family N-acetyltransferase [Acidobacteriota bacterium]